MHCFRVLSLRAVGRKIFCPIHASKAVSFRLFNAFAITAAIATLCGVSVYGTIIEPYRVEVRHVSICSDPLSSVLGGKTVLQISDLHITLVGRREEELLSIVERLKPDFIFLTGDYVVWDGDYEPALTFLSRLRAKMGIWAVMGDYDYSASRKSCLFCHEPESGQFTGRHGVRFLRDSYDTEELPSGRLAIVGLDSRPGNDPRARERILIPVEADATVILSHNPLNFTRLSVDTEALVLAGDTHGGQIPLPKWLWRLLGYEKNAKFGDGLFQEGKKKMYVSRGVGTSHLPIRLLRRPEIVVLHFQ